jgi:carbonic anhydrase
MTIMKHSAAVIIFLVQTVSLHSVTPIAEWNSLLQSHKNFVKNPNFAKQRAPLKNQQNPPVIVLSCSDSRVPPELIFDKGLGSLFVVRVAGHVVDNVVIDSIEYAVNHFDAHVIVILGHSNCGAVEGALEHLQKRSGEIDTPRGHRNAVLIPIETAIVESGINIYGLKALEESIQANIKYVANQLITRSRAISDALNRDELIIVGAEYSLNTGHVDQLFVKQQKATKSRGYAA